jgi:hypothetical protein
MTTLDSRIFIGSQTLGFFLFKCPLDNVKKIETRAKDLPQFIN